jgi:outer membrane protein assembly factor BamE (lipoprotein component of BamABCDE complex)
MKKILFALSAGLLFASCVPSTPQARIQQNQQKFSALGAKHQALVQQGQLSRGMSVDAVYLAWGSPSATFQGSQGGQLTERWDYASAQPVYTSNFSMGYGYGPGYGYGRHGHHGYHGGYGYSGMGFGFGPEIAYVPYRSASVWFVNHRVDSWERAR